MEILFTYLVYIVAFIALLTMVVAFHEYGHYFFAKLFGVKVETFSIGFGKELFGVNDKSGTRWKVCAVPLGGFVKMYGDENEASMADSEKLSKMSKKEKQQSFHFKPLWQKMIVVAAGPVANFLLSLVILATLFFFVGKPHATNELTKLDEDGAAYTAGLREGDKIIMIDGSKVTEYSDISRIVMLHPEITLAIKIDRQGEFLNFSVKPKRIEIKDAFGNDVEIGRIGVYSGEFDLRYPSIAGSLWLGVTETYEICASTLVALKQIFTGHRTLEDLGGPVRIAKYSAQSVDLGVVAFFWLVAIVSANLGLVNIFPIPVLDGGHMLYYAIEAIKGTPVSEKFTEIGNKIGITFVLALIIFAFVNDLRFIGFFEIFWSK